MIGAVGVGMTQASSTAALRARGRPDCFLLPGRYTLLEQSALPELLPLCAQRGISVIVGGVYNSGILADPSGAADVRLLPARPSGSSARAGSTPSARATACR